MALKLLVPSKTAYNNRTYKKRGKGTVLVVATEESRFEMTNGKVFLTGNHPVELFLPLLHLQAAGFDIEFSTPSGKPVAVEMWAMPVDDPNVQKAYIDFQPQLNKPKALTDVVASLRDDSPYVAVFLPGGHGAMLGLPENKELTKLLKWTKKQDKYLLAICHGPAALLAPTEDGKSIYDGYEIVAFPDTMDKITPYMGYLPGHLPWYFGERLAAKGVKITNYLANGYVHKDRKLVSGDSPLAANKFGELAAESLLSE